MPGGISFRTDANIKLLTRSLQQFNEVLSKSLKSGDRLVLTNENGMLKVATGAADKYVGRSAKPAEGGFSQSEENNYIRTALMNALHAQFGDELPVCVKNALKGSNVFVGGSDMKM